LFDSHCHLQDRAFAADLESVLLAARAAGLVGMALCGYDGPSNEAALRISAAQPDVFPTVGYHPHDANDLTAEALAELEALARLPEVVALGEIGLDFYRDLSPRDVQRRALEAQLALAVRIGKPVCVHSRGAEEEIVAQLEPYAKASPLRAAGRPVGVMHCFGGSLEQARRYAALGFLVSIACSITYPASGAAREIAAGLALEWLLVETDSPYLPPQPLRGKRNEPARVGAAAEAIAVARRTTVEHVATATTANAVRLFGVRVAEEVGVS
jgi:TatD DNase family protein